MLNGIGSGTIVNVNSCSSADETEDSELDPDIKAQREKERRQANNARERWDFFFSYLNVISGLYSCMCFYSGII